METMPLARRWRRLRLDALRRSHAVQPKAFLLCLAAAALSVGVGCSLRSEGPASGARADGAVSTFGSFGLMPGQFSSPRAVACGPRGRVAVIDKTGRVQLFDPRRVLIAHWPMPQTEKGTPTGLCFAGDGTLLIADTHYHRVLKYAPDGKLLASFGSYGEGPGQFIYPTDVAVAPDGAVYVAEYGIDDRIQKFDSAYSLVSQWGGHGTGPGRFRRPMGLAVDPAGNIYVADAVNHRIQKFSPDEEFVAAWGQPGRAPGDFMYPYDVAIDSEGRVVVCEYGNSRIQRLTAQGKPLGVFGQPGRSCQSLSSPWSLDVADDGRVFVADTLNHRLVVLSEACSFASPIP